jgi:hypothetical protein
MAMASCIAFTAAVLPNAPLPVPFFSSIAAFFAFASASFCFFFSFSFCFFFWAAVSSTPSSASSPSSPSSLPLFSASSPAS